MHYIKRNVAQEYMGMGKTNVAIDNCDFKKAWIADWI